MVRIRLNKEQKKEVVKNNIIIKKLKRDKAFKDRLLNKYNLSEIQYISIFVSQEYKCRICNRHLEPFNSISHIDHNHLDNKVRGILCRRCNLLLGLCNDDIVLLSNAISYLESKGLNIS